VKRLSRAGTLLLAVAALAPSIASGSPFGVNAHVPPDDVLDAVSYVGIGWIRVDFIWAMVEPEQDVYDWSLYDRVLASARSRGLRVYATFQGTPQWATSGPELSGVPDDPRQWQQLVYRAVSRYRGEVAAWGFWNEPNLPRFWSGTRQQYLDVILAPGIEAVRAADPLALVCAPDLAHRSSADWDQWLAAVVAAAGEELDVVTHHLYPSASWWGEVTLELEIRMPWSDSPSVREVLTAAGWFGRPFWLTETGLEADDYGETAQANFYTGLLRDWYDPERTLTWVDRVFFYQIHDDPRYPEETFGILGAPPALTPRQAYLAYRDVIRSSRVDDAEVAAADVPAFVAPGATCTALVTLRNTGSTDWSSADGYRLQAAVEEGGWSVEPDELGAETVTPGETVTCAVTLTAPATTGQPGTATLSARMERSGRWTFGQQLRRCITLTSEPPPEILAHPQGGIVTAGAPLSLAVVATSASELHYQWRHDSVPLENGSHLSGATTARLHLSAVDRAAAGDYDCVLTNAAGSVATRPAAVLVLEPTAVSPRRPEGRH